MYKQLRFLATMLLLAVCSGVWAETKTGTIKFGTNNVKIDANSIDAKDNLNNSWKITTLGTTSHTASSDYYQVGSSKAPATSIVFQLTLEKALTITSIEAKFGGFSGTAGTVGMKIGNSVSDCTEVGSGSLDATNDVTIKSTSQGTGTYVEVEITNIAKGVKCYYISYTYDEGGEDTPDPTTTPTITLESTALNVDANEKEGTIGVTYNNFTEVLAEVQFVEADGETETSYDWIDAEIDVDNNIYYTIGANNGEARTAYMKVYALDDNADEVYSDLITISQAAYVAPAASLGSYVKVTSSDDLTSGQYLIVYEEGSVAFNGGLESLDASSNTINIVISNNEIDATTATQAAEFTIDTTAGTVKSASGYYIGQTSDANGLASSETKTYSNTISFDENGNSNIVSSSAYLRYNATSGQNRFRYYKSSSYTNQKAIQMYKYVAPTAPEVTFSEEDANNATIADNKGKVVNATLTRTLSSDYWSTFSVPFDVDADMVKEVLGENVQLRKFKGSEGTVIKFEETDNIVAGHAYLVKPETTVSNPVFEGVTVVNTTGEMDPDDNDYGFVGAVIKTTLKTDKTELFLGTDGKFYYPESQEKATMKGLRGYFMVPEGTETSKMMIDFDGIATTIDAMNVEGLTTGSVFNMNGQAVGTSLNGLAKGIYLMNGKKYIVK